jgi:hypothetical protein
MRYGLKSPKRLALTLLLPFCLLITPAFAQDPSESMETSEISADVVQAPLPPVPSHPEEHRRAVPEPDAAPAYPKHEIGGWVDTAVVYDDLDGGQAGAPGFVMAQVGLRMAHEINENYGGFVQLNAFGPGPVLGVVAREAYGYYQTTDGFFKILGGKYYAPIGFELADPPDLYQFSNSLVFNNLIPTELVGGMVALQFTDNIDLKLYVSGPWDDDVGALQLGTKNLGTRLGFGFGDLGGIGFSAVGGAQDATGLQRIAYDVDLALTPAEGLLIGAEANANMIRQEYVNTAGELTRDFVTPMGFLVMTNYAFTDLFNLTLRYDMVIDAAVGAAGQAPGAPLFDRGPTGKALTLSSITVAPNFHLAEGWDIFTEIRYDMASQDIFSVDGSAKGGSVSGAIELIYQF